MRHLRGFTILLLKDSPHTRVVIALSILVVTVHQNHPDRGITFVVFCEFLGFSSFLLMAMAAEGDIPSDSGANPVSEGSKQQSNGRVEIDTSAPFESVKEAASRFGGMGFWRPPNFSSSPPPPSHQLGGQTLDIAELEQQAAQLRKDLVVKERETLDLLKELETTKLVVEELKANLQKQASQVGAANLDDDQIVKPAEASSEIDSGNPIIDSSGLHLCPSATPGYILLELKQAKLNLTRTTNDLADIRATVESYNKKIEKERISLEKTRQRLSSSALKVSSLETELNQTQAKLQLIKSADADGKISCDLAKELQRLSSETEAFKKVGEAARSEVLRTTSEIKQTKIRIKTAEIKFVAAKKMKEAARAAEAVALAEIKAMSNGENSASGLLQKKPEVVTITFEEYSSLMAKAREAEASCQSKLADAMLQVDEANVSNAEILRKVEEAAEEVKSSKEALEEALCRVEDANRGKLAVEEALRKWRSERGHNRRRPAHNYIKFKNAYPSHLLKDSRAAALDVKNGLNMENDDELKPVLKATLSIGQILSRKLLLTGEIENGMHGEKYTGKRNVSLAQMLGKQQDHEAYGGGGGGRGGDGEENAKQQVPAKRKKLGFTRISFLVTKQAKKKKKHSANFSGCLTDPFQDVVV